MDTQSSEHKYKMTIGLSVLDHMGRGLYSKVPAVLSEVVANAWDADAECVDITIDIEKRQITVCDNGFGMSADDINSKFLNIGYQKRVSESNDGITPRGRKPMGRKGIGKLSVFAIADTVEVQTVNDGNKSAFRMDFNDIRRQIEHDPNAIYHPVNLGSSTVTIAKGTKLVLSNLRKKRTPAASYIRRKLARRFSIIGKDNFSMSINGEPITARDRDYHNFMEYVWYFGEQDELSARFPNARKKVAENYIYGESDEYEISGWIGTVETQNQIDEETNGIVIFARGKLAHENLLDDMMQGGVWTKYVIGEIDANFMDESNSEDIITSARQSLNENDDRYIDLKQFLEQGVIKRIATNWLKWRREAGAERTLSERKNVKRWFDRLGPDQQKNAKQLFGKIEALEVMDEEGKRELYKASMLAFERLAITDQLSILSSLETERDFDLVSNIFGDLSQLASVHYYDIAKVRVEIIKKFRQIIDEDKKERIIQEHIFNALWLLDPSWERAATNSHMEETINKEFKVKESNLSESQKRARVDIRYQTVVGKHVIVELKRYSVKPKLLELLEQVSLYKKTLHECLVDKFGEQYRNAPIDVITITGYKPSSNFTPDDEEKLKVAAGVRCLRYDDLIDNALLSYSEYLQAETCISQLVGIIENIDKDFNT